MNDDMISRSPFDTIAHRRQEQPAFLRRLKCPVLVCQGKEPGHIGRSRFGYAILEPSLRAISTSNEIYRTLRKAIDHMDQLTLRVMLCQPAWIVNLPLAFTTLFCTQDHFVLAIRAVRMG